MTSNGHPSRVFGIINHTWSYLYIHSQGTGINLQLQFPPQTKSAKILWLGLVCLGFTGAGILIGKSDMEWQEKPIATTITTYPIDDLQFPQVTICPPKDSNTGLYHDLVKAGNRKLHMTSSLSRLTWHIQKQCWAFQTEIMWTRSFKVSTQYQHLTMMRVALRSRCGI